MTWVCELSEEAQRQLQRLPYPTQDQMVRTIEAVQENPFQGDVTSLKEKQWKGEYRRHVGRYRILFALDHQRHRIQISAILLRSKQTYR
ncbi:MAG: type II toxin-antitoxin system RelE/ParE family toxin [Acidobacteria bacterium]|nr:type II toxin-antitoxin system RelE/ParE family toxin [Acidobacteriota bacterium]